MFYLCEFSESGLKIFELGTWGNRYYQLEGTLATAVWGQLGFRSKLGLENFLVESSTAENCDEL